MTYGAIALAYRSVYERKHRERTEAFQAAVEKIKGRSEWEAVPDLMREPVIGPLQSRCCSTLDLAEAAVTCKTCGATLDQMDSDLAAQGGLFAQVVAQIQKLTAPPDQKIKRVRVVEFFSESVETEEQIRQSVNRLQDHLLKLLDEGVKIVLE